MRIRLRRRGIQAHAVAFREFEEHVFKGHRFRRLGGMDRERHGLGFGRVGGLLREERARHVDFLARREIHEGEPE